MFKLAYPMETEVVINGFTATVDTSFDNVLRLLDMLQDTTIYELTRIDIALEMLLSARFLIDYEEKYEIYQSIMDNFVLVNLSAKEVQIETEEKQKEYYSIAEDAEYIYPSFMQDYQIDLFEQQGKLSWLKFRSLLGGLSEETRFKKIVEIRQWQPDENTSQEMKEEMRKLKRIYALESSQEEIEFEAMDLLEKREYAEKQLALEKELEDKNSYDK